MGSATLSLKTDDEQMSRRADNTTTWKRHAGLNCDSTDMESPRGSSAGAMPLAQCQQTCVATPGCSAVTTDVLNLSWARHAAHNCYTGHGADELIDGSGTVDQCNEMTVAECKTQCFLTPGCSGVVYDNTRTIPPASNHDYA